jgi:predicted alpha/beta-hydrolase family hydrolase
MTLKEKDLILKMCKNSNLTLLLAHGAGAPMDSDWMNNLCQKLQESNISTIRFEFPYMQRRRIENKKFPPNRMPLLIEKWEEVLNYLWKKNQKKLFIGGKSMGGRAATFINHPSILGLVNFGFPFHAPGKEPGERIKHLEVFDKKMLILQGERDSMGNKEEILSYKISQNIRIHYLEDGDHSLKPRVKSGKTLEDNIEEATRECKKFMEINGQ